MTWAKSALINCSACLNFKAPKFAHIPPLLYSLHWLPVSSRIQYKIALICFHIVSGIASLYRPHLLHFYSPSRSFPSASDARIFRVPRMGRRTPPPPPPTPHTHTNTCTRTYLDIHKVIRTQTIHRWYNYFTRMQTTTQCSFPSDDVASNVAVSVHPLSCSLPSLQTTHIMSWSA